jgi:hypothetical protein
MSDTLMTLAAILVIGGCMLGSAGKRIGVAIAVFGIFVAWGIAIAGATGN